jgi:hypothetical protein
MLRTADAAAAIRLGLCIVHDVGARHGFPLVRVGMHTGPAVERGGDWFGATVNLAARVSAAAGGGEALLTEATKAALARWLGGSCGNVDAGHFAMSVRRSRCTRPSARGRAAPRGCRLIRCAGWRSILGMAQVGSPTKAWSTAFARSSAPARSLSTPTATPGPIAHRAAAPERSVAGEHPVPLAAPIWRFWCLVAHGRTVPIRSNASPTASPSQPGQSRALTRTRLLQNAVL